MRLLGFLYDPGSELACEGPAKCLFRTSMSSVPRGLRPSCALYDPSLNDPNVPLGVRSGLAALAEVDSFLGGVFGAACPNEPLKAWDSDDVPGPGTEVPVAPASGAWFPSYCALAVVVCDRAGEPPTGVAKRAVEEALEGD